ncbi:hypothetical protein KP77_21610 [Jeotgalibacillus alimentarius]|uniref:Uncharacterized protein n=1 Tax=Jeotgalibacillus alimentarius TaxID=135826 RepID=A0A0C2RFJ4_9BACL|nr:hypothetical protein KP77_21610 [Jeotgalibacillus alimentarius]
MGIISWNITISIPFSVRKHNLFYKLCYWLLLISAAGDRFLQGVL